MRPAVHEVARVNGVTLTSDRLDSAVSALVPMESFHRNVSPEKMAALRQKALGQLVDDELGGGDPELAHLALYDRFLETIGAIVPAASAEELAGRVHPRVRELLAALHDRTANRSLGYAIGMRGLGGECVCGVYFSVMHGQLRRHPLIIEREASIDWRFWGIHAGEADAEHNKRLRAAVAELLIAQSHATAVSEVAAGYDYGTAVWDEFWTTIYGDHLR